VSDRTICYSREEILKVLRTLDTCVVSLDRIGSSGAELSQAEFDEVLREFIVGWDVTRQLAHARRILSEPFSEELGEDDMDELEREMQDVPRWSFNKRAPPE
jgi:hypothetical protein